MKNTRSRIHNITISTFIISILFALTSTAFAHEPDKTKFVYKGDESARGICLAIAKDQPRKLKRTLKAKRTHRLEANIHKHFTCNGKDLLSFASEVGSAKVYNFLAKKYESNGKKLYIVDGKKG